MLHLQNNSLRVSILMAHAFRIINVVIKSHIT